MSILRVAACGHEYFRLIDTVAQKQGRRSWGGWGGRVPPQFFEWGGRISNYPPPLFNMFNEVLFLGNLKT